MRLLVMSDLYNEYEAMPLVSKDGRRMDADAVVLAGDIHSAFNAITWAREAFQDKQIVQVAGNHEYWHWDLEQALDQLREQAQRLQVHFLENDAIEIDGVRFLGCTLWTDFKIRGDYLQRRVMDDAYRIMRDYRVILSHPDGAIKPHQILAKHEQSAAWLERELSRSGWSSEKTVVVTHHAPVAESLGWIPHDCVSAGAYASRLDQLMGYAGLWVHGHVHHSFDREMLGTRVLANPAGGFEDGVAMNGDFSAVEVEV